MLNFRNPRIGLLAVLIAGVLVSGVLYLVYGNNNAEEAGQEVNTTQGQQAHVAAVVTAHDKATDIGIEILEAGGTAADAAVAVAAALSVVEPWFSSALGGGTWALYYDADENQVTSLDGVGPTGSNASVENYRGRAGSFGMHQANVPGAWDGWMLWLDEYGELDLDEVLAPAIRVAREGYEVSADMEQWLNTSSGRVFNYDETGEIYLRNGNLLSEGDTVHQHDMADTFESLANAYAEALEDGERSQAVQAARDYYYRGPIAEAIVAYSDQDDGYLTIDDFWGFEAEIVTPLSLDYRDGLTVYQNPPNSQGITMLSALNILMGYDFSQYDSNDPDAVHLQIEALKRAFADRYYHVGDPDRVDVPVDTILSEEHAERHRENISLDETAVWPIEDPLDGEASNTTTFHIVDTEGNAAAVTTSLGAQFLVIGDTGIHINNRMRFMALDEDDPNVLSPGYKVRHTSNPYLVTNNGNLYMLGGNVGADTQAQAQLQQFINIVEFGYTAQEAVDRPRFVSNAFPSTIFPYEVENTLEVEDDFPEALRQGLSEKGHGLTGGTIFGNAGIIVISEDGREAQLGVEQRNQTSAGSIILPE